MSELQKYRNNKYYSQFGEDGIIEEILVRLSKKIKLDNWCSEFGAWDGVHLSNTCYFIREKKYKAILIESEISKLKSLELNFPQKTVYKINQYVSFTGKNSLDNIFKQYEIPKNFDILSIDVDGVDYYIFESLNIYRPKIICVEFNPTIPNALEFVQKKDTRIKQGASAKALVNLAKKKGYSLIASTDCNLIFLDKKLSKFVINKLPTLKSLNLVGNDPIYLFTGYDGTILSNKEKINLVWHDTEVLLSDIQFLPSFLRRYFGDYNLLQKIFLKLIKFFKTP